jgi:hypothetical protein
MMGRQNRDKRQLFYEFIPVWERYPSPDGMFSRGDFAYDAGRDVYVCPNGKSLRTSGTVHDGRVRNYLSQPQDCRACTLKQRCTRAPFKKIARDINEDARNHARSLRGTPEFERSSNARKKVEMRFAHLKVQHGFERMRLRGLTGARDEFHLAAIVQNLKAMALRLLRPPTDGALRQLPKRLGWAVQVFADQGGNARPGRGRNRSPMAKYQLWRGVFRQHRP